MAKAAGPVRINPGDRAKDIISGYEGIAICRTEWIYGCVRVSLQAEETQEGKPVEAFTFDEAQLKLIKAQAIKSPNAGVTQAEAPAGDRPNAVRRPDASRR